MSSEKIKYQKLTFHHVGIPVINKLTKSSYNESLKMSSIGYFDSPYAMEWMEFDDDNELPEIIKTQPHIGYVVENLEEAIVGRNVILEPNSPTEGVTIAFILDGRDLIEFLQFDKPEEDVWPHPHKFLLESL